MASSDFERALSFTLSWEGGYVDHPADPGGPTNRGITQAVYSAFRRKAGLPTQPVAQISDGEVSQIYRLHYWEPVEAHTKPDWRVFRLALFDTFVNFGVRGGTELWQLAARVQPDGAWGPQTARATADLVMRRGSLWAAVALVGERIRYRGRRVRQARNQGVFLEGWLNRDTALLLQLFDWQAEGRS